MLKEKLYRIRQALNLLLEMLEEEFSCLKNRKMDKIADLEVCIQGLLEQLNREKQEFIIIARKKGFDSVFKFFNNLGQIDKYSVLLTDIKQKEQKIKILSAKNNALAVALANQTANMLNFLQTKIKESNPENPVYTNGGKLVGRPNINLRG
ncbi:FlgN protein [Desulfonauticus submarinus]|uniref:FlgN protein n=1 Tax=Desulfonauticus submarinus TaxID=206665 RepID=A0A1H0AJX0_9BACT|nr:flagellar export chaperone FlgN [Desulfonauticus submarinus]SDN33749.1 FlgN protein [Desulfonauticus submarinus]